MGDSRQYRNVYVFLFVYLLLAWPPFLYLNQEVLTDVYERLALVDPLTILWITGASVVLIGLLRARAGVIRYTRFLRSPTNTVSVLVSLSFVVAAVAWWALPEIVFYLELGVTLNQILVLILACQIPMLLFLSLLTVVGTVHPK